VVRGDVEVRGGIRADYEADEAARTEGEGGGGCLAWWTVSPALAGVRMDGWNRTDPSSA